MGLSDLVKKATGAPTPEKARSGSISHRPSLEQDSVDKGAAEGDDVSVLDEKEGNVILAMISQRPSSAFLFRSLEERGRDGGESGLGHGPCRRRPALGRLPAFHPRHRARVQG
jgi:hypothetical protein